VPFILASQAALIETRYLWPLCLAGAVLAAVRFSGLKRFISQLNFPATLLRLGLLVLALNAALPVVYRLLHEHKVGTKLESGAAYYTNECLWLMLLPALCALANLLPPPRQAATYCRNDRGFLWGFLPVDRRHRCPPVLPRLRLRFHFAPGIFGADDLDPALDFAPAPDGLPPAAQSRMAACIARFAATRDVHGHPTSHTGSVSAAYHFEHRDIRRHLFYQRDQRLALHLLFISLGDSSAAGRRIGAVA